MPNIHNYYLFDKNNNLIAQEYTSTTGVIMWGESNKHDKGFAYRPFGEMWYYKPPNKEQWHQIKNPKNIPSALLALSIILPKP